MTEQLIIRLGSQHDEPVLWWLWSRNDQGVIAEGELAGSDQLPELKAQAHDFPVLVLVPGMDVTLRTVELPGKVNRQLLQALPFMLEEELCQDMELLHVALLNIAGRRADVAVVAHDKMTMWLGWLKAAGMKPQRLLPEALALPPPTEHWQALALQSHWLIRTGTHSGLAIEAEWLAPALTQLGAADQSILSHSGIPDGLPGQWHDEPHAQASQLLAEGAIHSRVSLLSGAYQPSHEWRKHMRKWLWSGGVGMVCLLLLLMNRWLELSQLDALQRQLAQQSQAVYLKTFPDERRVINVREQMNRHLTALSTTRQDQGFLVMLAKLQPAFSRVPSIKLISLRYDESRGELRMQATVDNFQAFELLRTGVPDGIEVEQGALTQQGARVSGTITFRGTSS